MQDSVRLFLGGWQLKWLWITSWILSISAMAINWQYFNSVFPHNPEGEFLSVHRAQCHTSNLIQRALRESPLSPGSPIWLLFVTPSQCVYYPTVKTSWTLQLSDHTECLECDPVEWQGTLALLFWGICLCPTKFSHTDFFPSAIAGVLVAYEGLPLHLALFPKLWTELCQTQVRVRANRMETGKTHWMWNKEPTALTGGWWSVKYSACVTAVWEALLNQI